MACTVYKCLARNPEKANDGWRSAIAKNGNSTFTVIQCCFRECDSDKFGSSTGLYCFSHQVIRYTNEYEGQERTIGNLAFFDPSPDLGEKM
jgi:hypothetical protein